MRISDLSSDVCSSDLDRDRIRGARARSGELDRGLAFAPRGSLAALWRAAVLDRARDDRRKRRSSHLEAPPAGQSCPRHGPDAIAAGQLGGPATPPRSRPPSTTVACQYPPPHAPSSPDIRSLRLSQ